MEFAVEAQKLVSISLEGCRIMLQLQNLKASVNNKSIINGLNLEIKPGEVHAIMGPNGSGKKHFSQYTFWKKRI